MSTNDKVESKQTDKQAQQPCLSSNLAENCHAFASQGPATTPIEKAKNFPSGAPQGLFVQNKLENPDDGVRFDSEKLEIKNQVNKNSGNDMTKVFQHAESNGEVKINEKQQEESLTTESSTQQYAN